MRIPTITRPYWPGRSVGARTFPITLQPEPPPVAPTALRGGFVNTVPASTHIIDGEGIAAGRAFLGRTEDDLNTGTKPDRINRGTNALNAGTIGDNMAGWPYDGNAVLVPHTTIPRTPITVTPFARTIDTGVTVPSLPIGTPV